MPVEVAARLVDAHPHGFEDPGRAQRGELFDGLQGDLPAIGGAGIDQDENVGAGRFGHGVPFM
ncbi:hypothetical protein [Nocardia spumae]|uniref:hypothetical protein n=1 Tax=Nocardia spumae TaxID=2887190 RepID=UPI001D13B903|nr:hypothetical protein [Nocardia spumae]